MNATQRPGKPPVPDGQVFEKVLLFPGQNGVGTVTAHPGQLEFDSPQVHVTVPDVREITFVYEKVQADALQRTPRVRVTYGTGADLSTVHLAKLQVGLPRKVKAANEQLAAGLATACGTSALSPADRVQVERATALVQTLDFDVQQRAGRTRMVISAIVFTVGALVTLISYSAAEAGGGFVVAWGAMVFGALFFLAGYVQYRRAGQSKADAAGRAGAA